MNGELRQGREQACRSSFISRSPCGELVLSPAGDPQDA